MKKFMLLILISLSSFASADIAGSWISIDDNTGEKRVRVEITQQEDNSFKGVIVEVFNPKDDPTSRICSQCKGEFKDLPIIGFPLLRELKEKNGQYEGGFIIDPENGKEYKLKANVNEKGLLEVRGFIGFSLFGRTQTWLPDN